MNMKTKLLLVSKCFISINRCKLHIKSSLFGRQTYFPLVINIPTNITNTIFNITKRYKSSDTKRIQNQFIDTTTSEVDTDDEDDFLPEGKGRKKMNITVNSLRVDLVVKTGFGISRNKIENAFFDKRIQKNGFTVLKKSENVMIDDELDIIVDKNSTNPNLLTVSRITIMDIILEDDKYKLKVLREKNLIVENKSKKV